MSIIPTPTVFGFYWAKQIAIDPGHPDFENCPFEPSGDWEVVELVENCLNADDPQYRKVQVLGMSQWQSPENFAWGQFIVKPVEYL